MPQWVKDAALSLQWFGWLLWRRLVCLFIYLFLVLFLGPHLRHMEVPRLGIESELQLPAYTTVTATATLD